MKTVEQSPYGRRAPAARGYSGTGTLVAYTDADGQRQYRTWPNALPHHRTPCRADETKGLHQHRCSTAHRELVQGYRAIRELEEQAAEAASIGYDTELAEYWRDHPRTTFKDYLTGMRDTTGRSAA